MKSFSWMHISDLHVGTSSQQWLWPSVKDQFLLDVRKVFDHSGQWQAVIFSGDLTRRGDAAEFLILTDILSEMWQSFDKLGFAPTLIAVPGNHDLVRPPEESASAITLKQWHDIPMVRNTFWKTSDNEYRQLVAQAFENYTEWTRTLQNKGIPVPQDATAGILPGDFSCRLGSSELQIGIVGLNSAFLQIGSEDYQQKLALDIRQFHAVTNGDPTSWCNGNNLNLLVTHHPPEWLHPDSLEAFRADIFPPGRFFAHIYGHLHEPSLKIVAEGGADGRRALQGASLFGLKLLGNGVTERLHGYSVSQVDPGSQYRFWPRKIIKAIAGNWKMVSDQQYELDSQEALVEVIEAAEEKRGEENQLDQNSQIPVLIGIDDVAARPLKERLRNVPTIQLRQCSEHRHIRLSEQNQMLAALQGSRAAWLSCDWGQGKDGFLATVLGRLPLIDAPIYRLSCDALTCKEDILAQVEEQFGLTLQEFCSAFVQGDDAFFLFDDAATDTNLNAGRPFEKELESLAALILEYCSGIRIVISSRTPPHQSDYSYVELKALDEADTRLYVKEHPEGGVDLTSPSTIEQIFRVSEGVPMQIDRLLGNLKFMTLEELLEIELEESQGSSASEPAPSALVRAISKLEKSSDRYTNRSFRLLKILTVLSSGDTFSRIRRFDPNEPLHPQNVDELVADGLIEAIPVPETIIQEAKATDTQSVHTKKLVVPRPVRDYVKGLMSESEVFEITKRAASVYFGDRWAAGNPKFAASKEGLRSTTQESPAGSYYIVILKLLNEAVYKHPDTLSLASVVSLARFYCQHLLNAKLFRLAAAFSKDVLHAAENHADEHDLSWFRSTLGISLRMIGRADEAVVLFERVLEATPTKEISTTVLLNLALALEALGRKPEAMATAKQLRLLEPDEQTKIHSDAIILNCADDDPERFAKLRRLEGRARKKGFQIVANNIALVLAKQAKPSDGQAEGLYRRAMEKPASDMYNAMRAAVRLAIEFQSSNHLDSLTPSERTLIIKAYSYSYAQRMSQWFDNCHRAVWSIFESRHDIPHLLELFRHSSFVWRLYDKEENEAKYIELLQGLGVSVHMDEARARDPALTYLLQRLTARRDEEPKTED